ncbi:hypothetical protein NDU88_000798 [Pleurodeles waltl]|uniref:Uncharacterized protein n=1 Tax=Pleurodeles waltl TaxID=8319 RepID=A0AAV7R5A2_PLEWA|nr:hypothetical protein NDU88_000798 [Pleurodeles waltl]
MLRVTNAGQTSRPAAGDRGVLHGVVLAVGGGAASARRVLFSVFCAALTSAVRGVTLNPPEVSDEAQRCHQVPNRQQERS